MTPRLNASKTSLEGRIDRILYRSENSCYTVAHLKTRSASRPVTIVGFLPEIEPGETVMVSGAWKRHPRFGDQLRVNTCEVKLPASTESILAYLNNGAVKGIGARMADRLVSHFGGDTLEIIQSDPARLQEVNGIGPSKADAIVRSWNDRHGLRGLMQFFQEAGVNPAYGAGIYRLYGKEAVTILKTNPYRVAEEIPGFGFVVADSVSRYLGTPQNDPFRVRACIVHVLERSVQEGHTYITESQFYPAVEKLFGLSWETANEGLNDLVDEGHAIIEELDFETDGSRLSAVYLNSLYQAEVEISRRLSAMISLPFSENGLDAADISETIVRKLAIQLSEEQFDVLTGVLSQRVAVITGGPGTGKTTLIRSLKAVLDVFTKRVLLAAPTGRAARRLSEITGAKAVTVHRLLGCGFQEAEEGSGNFFRNRDNPLQADAVIIDEASMMDILLTRGLVNALSPSCRLILVGDGFQLPSVGPGNVLPDLIESEQVPVFYLNRIFRQALKSPIVLSAHRVREGKMPDVIFSEEPGQIQEFFFIEENISTSIAYRIVDLCKEELPAQFSLDPIQDIQIITPMHRGAAGTMNLNQVLQKALNPDSKGVETLGGSFKIGDKVMHLKNNYDKEVFNGDIGIIDAVYKKENRLSVDYFGRMVDYDFSETNELSLAYAISVHKSQGSEYPAVIVPLTTEHYPLLQRNLLYTAITRGVRLVVLIGSRKALSIALNNNRPAGRLSSLAYRLRTKG